MEMFQGIKEKFASVDWAALMENVSNDRLVELFTHPYGMAGLGVLMLISVLLKWRITFVALTGCLLVSLLTRYALVGETTGPDRTVLMFAGGGVAIAAFIIYNLFIREE